MLQTRQQIRVPKTAELIAGQIRKAIIRRELRTGDNLPSEAQLIERFEVSRPTIREAIRILESENLISVSRGARGGAKVTEPTPATVATSMGTGLQSQGATIGDVYAARMMIEPAAAKMAAKERPKAAAAALRAHIAKEYEALDRGETSHTQAIADFHRILVEECGNKTLALIAQALHGVIQKHQALVHRSRPEDTAADRLKRVRAAYKSQEKLAELIAAGDGAGAEAHWLKHMQNAAEILLDRVAQTSLLDVLE